MKYLTMCGLWGYTIVEKHTVEYALHAYAWHTQGGLITVEVPQHYGCCDGGDAIGCRYAYPHSVRSPNLWEDDEEWHKEHKLTANGEENALLHHADALEEVACDNLEANNWEHADDDTHTRNGKRNQCFVFSKQQYRVSWEELAKHKSTAHDNCGKKDCFFQHFCYAVQMTSTKIVSCYRLHSLTDAEHRHDKKERDAVDNAICRNGKVASVLCQSFVDEDDDETCTELHTEWRKSDGKDVLHEAFLQSIYACMQVYEVVLVGKYRYYIYEGDNLCKDCCVCRTFDAHAECEDEKRVENGVYHNCCDGGNHGNVRMSRASQGGIHSQKHMGDDIA